jgi:hypothetical protein
MEDCSLWLPSLRFMAGGTGVGFAIGAWDGNAAIRGNAAISLMIFLGAVSAVGCLVRNRQVSNKKDASFTIRTRGGKL